MTKLQHWTLIALAVVVVVLGFEALTASLRASKWEAEVETLLTQSDSLHANLDASRGIVDSLSMRVDSLEGVGARIRTIIRRDTLRLGEAKEAVRLSETQADSIVALVAVVKVQDDVIARQAELIVNQDATIAFLKQQVVVLDSALTTAETRVFTLEDVLKRRPSRCKILGVVSCPSRTVAFVLGGLAGAVVVSRLP